MLALGSILSYQYKAYHLFVYRDHDVIHTSGNEAYLTRDHDVIHTSGNEAYLARDHDVIHTSGNEAYLARDLDVIHISGNEAYLARDLDVIHISGNEAYRAVKQTEGTGADPTDYETPLSVHSSSQSPAGDSLYEPV